MDYHDGNMKIKNNFFRVLMMMKNGFYEFLLLKRHNNDCIKILLYGKVNIGIDGKAHLLWFCI